MALAGPLFTGKGLPAVLLVVGISFCIAQIGILFDAFKCGEFGFFQRKISKSASPVLFYYVTILMILSITVASYLVYGMSIALLEPIAP